jgi:hypothetical protein
MAWLRVLPVLVIVAACARGDEPVETKRTTATDTGTAPVPTQGPEAKEPLDERPSFGEAHMASVADASREEPDPATYTSTFPASANAIYVVYRLKEGVGGRVTATWRQQGQVVMANDPGRQLPGDGTWAFEAITPPPGGFPLGSYEVELKIAETGETRTLSFAVTS